jgi:hypothetical protein
LGYIEYSGHVGRRPNLFVLPIHDELIRFSEGSFQSSQNRSAHKLVHQQSFASPLPPGRLQRTNPLTVDSNQQRKKTIQNRPRPNLETDLLDKFHPKFVSGKFQLFRFVIPIYSNYQLSGHFSKPERLKDSLIFNLIWNAVLAVLGLIGLIYLLASKRLHFSQIWIFVVSLVNA